MSKRHKDKHNTCNVHIGQEQELFKTACNVLPILTLLFAKTCLGWQGGSAGNRQITFIMKCPHIISKEAVESS